MNLKLTYYKPYKGKKKKGPVAYLDQTNTSLFGYVWILDLKKK